MLLDIVLRATDQIAYMPDIDAELDCQTAFIVPCEDTPVGYLGGTDSFFDPYLLLKSCKLVFGDSPLRQRRSHLDKRCHRRMRFSRRSRTQTLPQPVVETARNICCGSGSTSRTAISAMSRTFSGNVLGLRYRGDRLRRWCLGPKRGHDSRRCLAELVVADGASDDPSERCGFHRGMHCRRCSHAGWSRTAVVSGS